MLDLIYDLSPDENISEIDGHLLVLVYTPGDQLAALVADRLYNRVARLDDASEFQFALVASPGLYGFVSVALELPSIYHFYGGRVVESAGGVDECLDFFDEFVIANRCSKKHTHGKVDLENRQKRSGRGR